MNTDKEYEFRFIAGVFVRKPLRQMLENERFVGREFRWIEEKNLLESVFRVRGNATDVKAIESRVNAYINIIDAAQSRN